MRKVIAQLQPAQRAALLYLADLCIALFSSTLIVAVIKTVVDWVV
jgi:hypothetical protein